MGALPFHFRFTPTCVGNTKLAIGASTARSGSPPHAWGIQWFDFALALWLRFTPTCVGNTGAGVLATHFSAVHPHMRGEYVNYTDCWLTRRRFTPTCVGNTACRFQRRPRLSVHPHMRGEYPCSQHLFCITSGSPPHAWGIHLYLASIPNRHRFTPTCVGNTLLDSSSLSPRSVHPHMRGEYSLFALAVLSYLGSPPHAWGILSI